MSIIAERSVPDVAAEPGRPREKVPDPVDLRITRILNGEEQPPTDVSDALALVRHRFGCVFHALPAEMRRQFHIIRQAAIGSCGHELQYVEEDVRHALGPTFFADLIDNGVPTWAMKYASPLVQDSPAVRFASERAAKRQAEHLQALLAKYATSRE